MAGIFVREAPFPGIKGIVSILQKWGRKEDVLYLLPLGNWTPYVKMKELENIFVSHLQALKCASLFSFSAICLALESHRELNVS